MSDKVDEIKAQIAAAPIVLYMKGSPSFPQCGFSAHVVGILNHLGVEYSSHDILADEELRQTLKTFSSWPTFPQLYVGGELVGGCDIVTELYESGELAKMLGVEA